MKAYKCDRCGKLFSDYCGYPDVFTNPDGYHRVIYVTAAGCNIDMCGTCRAELREWWNAKGAPTDVQPDVNEEE